MKKNQNTESDSKLGKAIDAMEREAHMSAAEQAALEQDEDMKQACRDIACLEKVLLRQHLSLRRMLRRSWPKCWRRRMHPLGGAGRDGFG